MKIRLVFILLFFVFGCGGSDWDYPIKLGDSREKVVSILGSGNLTIGDIRGIEQYYTYPKSGVSVEFDEFNKVEELRFVSDYYVTSNPSWIRYDGKIVFGIDLDMKLDDLNKILGEPIGQEFDEQFSWKKDGIVIQCHIWMRSFEDSGGKVEKHTIRSLILKRGI